MRVMAITCDFCGAESAEVVGYGNEVRFLRVDVAFGPSPIATKGEDACPDCKERFLDGLNALLDGMKRGAPSEP